MKITACIKEWCKNIFSFGRSKENNNLPNEFANKRILIIEDDISTRNATSSVLTRRNFETLCASTGEEGLSLLKDNLVDLIILDSKLPGIQGPEVCRSVKENETTAHIPIIFLTVVSTTDNIISSFDYGADNYLIKPVSPAQLIKQIEKLLTLAK